MIYEKRMNHTESALRGAAAKPPRTSNIFDFPKKMFFLDYNRNLEAPFEKQMICQDSRSLCRFSSKS